MRSSTVPLQQSRRDYRNTATSSSSVTSNNEEDKMRLRSFLRGAISQKVVATPDEEQQSKLMMKRVLARTQSMDPRRATSSSSEQASSAAETTSQAASSVASSLSLQTRSTLSLHEHPATIEEEPKPPTRRLERVDANPMAADFRNRLRNATRSSPVRPMAPHLQQQQQSTSMLDSKTREMIQERFRNRHQVAAASKVAVRETIVYEEEKQVDDDDPDLEGYDTFFQTLQQEVHGQHSLVCYFYALFHLFPSRIVSNLIVSFFTSALGLLFGYHEK